jgi:hypothetical protein
MSTVNSIRWKAFVMLVTFTASFTVFCHCETVTTPAAACCKNSCCGDKKSDHDDGKKTQHNKDDHGCQGMQAVKLNLQDKQTATAIHMAPLPMVVLPMTQIASIRPSAEPKAQSPAWPDRHSPPDLLSLHQCFLI